MAVDVGGLDAVPLEGLHLVAHQGDERREDDADALHGEGRHLEGDALAAARRHKGKRVAPRNNALDDLALYAAEVVVTPILMKNLAILHTLSACCSRRPRACRPMQRGA